MIRRAGRFKPVISIHCRMSQKPFAQLALHAKFCSTGYVPGEDAQHKEKNGLNTLNLQKNNMKMGHATTRSK